MSITNNNLNLNLIMELLGHFVPDDIKHKIFIILLGIGKCGVKDAKQHKMLNIIQKNGKDLYFCQLTIIAYILYDLKY